MMSVTSLRNLKKVLIQFLHEETELEKEALIRRRDELLKELKAHVLAHGVKGVEIQTINVNDDGTVMITARPITKTLEAVNQVNEELDALENEFHRKTLLVERWFTLAEASDLLHLPEMPDEIKEMLDRMINSLG